MKIKFLLTFLIVINITIANAQNLLKSTPARIKQIKAMDFEDFQNKNISVDSFLSLVSIEYSPANTQLLTTYDDRQYGVKIYFSNRIDTKTDRHNYFLKIFVVDTLLPPSRSRFGSFAWDQIQAESIRAIELYKLRKDLVEQIGKFSTTRHERSELIKRSH